jgi:17beta-estradiol 17-dehydrogenase / very-long-chain 3-oxoacyl-CoA reductase
MSTYPATKAAINFYTDNLYDEFKNTNIKIQCLIPNLVATKIISNEPKEAAPICVVHPETYAKYAVRIIGKSRISTGCFYHDLHFSLQKLIGFWLFKRIFVTLGICGLFKRRVGKNLNDLLYAKC